MGKCLSPITLCSLEVQNYSRNEINLSPILRHDGVQSSRRPIRTVEPRPKGVLALVPIVGPVVASPKHVREFMAQDVPTSVSTNKAKGQGIWLTTVQVSTRRLKY